MGFFKGFSENKFEKLMSQDDVDGLCEFLADKKSSIVKKVLAGINTVIARDHTKVSQPVLDAMFLSLQHPDCEIKKTAADILSLIGSPAISKLIMALQDEETVKYAIDALGKIKASQLVLDALQQSLHYPKQRVKEATVDVLIKIGSPAVSVLIDALQDASVCKYAANALGEINDSRTVLPLLNVLSSSQDKDYKKIALTALNKIDPQWGKRGNAREIISFLMKELDCYGVYLGSSIVAAFQFLNPNWKDCQQTAEAISFYRKTLIAPWSSKYTREFAVGILDNLQWEPKDPADHMFYDITKGHWEAMDHCSEAGIRALVCILLEKDDKLKESKIIEALIKLDSDAVPVLLETAISNSNSRGFAINILGLIKDNRATEPLIALLRDPSARDYARITAKALAKIADSRAIKPLMEELKHVQSLASVLGPTAFLCDEMNYWEGIIKTLEFNRIEKISNPFCRRCGKKLDILKTELPDLYQGIVCTICGRIECLNCRKDKPNLDSPCDWCKSTVSPAYKNIL